MHRTAPFKRDWIEEEVGIIRGIFQRAVEIDQIHSNEEQIAAAAYVLSVAFQSIATAVWTVVLTAVSGILMHANGHRFVTHRNPFNRRTLEVRSLVNREPLNAQNASFFLSLRKKTLKKYNPRIS